MYVNESVAGRMNAEAELQQARDMYNNGADGQDVYDQTGFFQGPDGIMRTNISDANFEMSGELDDGETMRVDQAVNHPELFEVLPEVGATTISANPNADGRGGYYPELNHIEVESADDDVAIAHEIQHAVQTETGMPEGSIGTNEQAAGGMENYRNDYGEVEAFDTMENIGETPPETPDLLEVAEDQGYEEPSPSIGMGMS